MIQSIIDTVSDVIVKKLLSNGSFVDKLADKLMSKGVLDNSSCIENVSQQKKKKKKKKNVNFDRMFLVRRPTIKAYNEADSMQVT